MGDYVLWINGNVRSLDYGSYHGALCSVAVHSAVRTPMKTMRTATEAIFQEVLTVQQNEQEGLRFTSWFRAENNEICYTGTRAPGLGLRV